MQAEIETWFEDERGERQYFRPSFNHARWRKVWRIKVETAGEVYNSMETISLLQPYADDGRFDKHVRHKLMQDVGLYMVETAMKEGA